MERTWRWAAVAILAVMASDPAVAQGPGRLIPVAGGQLHMEQCGTGDQAMVLVHDGVVHSAIWDGIWADLCRRYRVVRYDRRGYGRSPAATVWHSEVADLLAVFKAAGVGKAVLVGSSHGGELSIDFTLANPDRVSLLVLVGPVLNGFTYTEHFIRRGGAMLGPLRTGDVAGAIEAVSRDRYLLAPGHPENQKRLAALLTANPQDLTHPGMILPEKAATGRLAEIAVPTLIVVGEADIPDVHAHIGAIEAGIPRARRVVMPDAGHLPYFEHPAEFARLLTEFVNGHR